MQTPSIYDWVLGEETRFETEKVQIGSNWEWNLRDHVQLIFHLMHSQFYTGQNDWLRAFKNIMEPIIELCSWTEDIEVKDIVFFIENERGRVLSFLIKKYYEEIYVKEHDLDTFIDELIDTDLTYGGALIQKTSGKRPEVIELNKIAFCDQTDMLGSPIAFKHYFSPSKLREMEKIGWGNKENGATMSLEELCTLARPEKDAASMPNNKTNYVPGKQIEVYVVMGNMPDHYLEDNNDMEYYCDQIQVIAYYYDKKRVKQGVTLYRKENVEELLKFFTSKKVYGRALGRGVAERLLHPQIWTNWNEIKKNQLVEGAALNVLWTDDENYTNRNSIQEMSNLEITRVESGKQIGRVPTAAPDSIRIIENQIDTLFQHAQLHGAAFDPILGDEQPSGTTFRGQERTVAQGKGAHNKRKGKRAKFLEEVYREMIIPDMKKEIVSGKKFLATLSAEEVSWISEELATNYARDKQLDALWEGKLPEQEEVYKQEFLADLSKKGSKFLIEILKGEFKDIEVKMGINVAGKQKDLVTLTDKLLSIFQFAFANPQGFLQAMQIPALAKSFQDILEFSGMNQSDFATLLKAPVNALPTPAAPQGAPQPAPKVAAPAAV